MQVRFVTEDESLPVVPSVPLWVPMTLRRKALSELVNHLAAQTGGMDVDSEDDEEDGTQASAVPLDFLVANQFLRSDLSAAVKTHGLSREAELVLEYTRMFREPEEKPREEEVPDWISAVDCGVEGLVLSACMDGSVNVHDLLWEAPAATRGKKSKKKKKQEKQTSVLATGSVHGVAATCLAVLHNVWDAESSVHTFASGSKDQTLVVWEYDPSTRDVQAVARCPGDNFEGLDVAGHSASVQCVAASPVSVDKARQRPGAFVSGGWDNQLLVWDLEERVPDYKLNGSDSTSSSSSSAKQRKMNSSSSSSSSALPLLRPLLSFQGHSAAVTCCVWPHIMAMYSGSWDHTLRMWDTQAGVNSSTWNTGRPINSLDFSQDFNLMATGHDDRVVRTWDPRQSGKEALKVSLKDHEGWVSCVKWVRMGAQDAKSPQDDSSPSPSSFAASGARAQLATCSYDGTIKIWDLRAAAPLFTSQTQAKGGSAAKFLSVDWASQKTLVAAGEKGRLDIIQLQ